KISRAKTPLGNGRLASKPRLFLPTLTVAVKLFRLLLFFLCKREGLGFSPTCRAFPNVVSAVTVSHGSSLSASHAQFQAFSLPPGVLITHRQARGALRGVVRFRSCRDSRKWHNLGWLIAVLANRG